MAVENHRGGFVDEGVCDRFPIGMRVLAVDDEPVCLKVLETLLRKCQYHVTTSNQAIEALRMLRENRDEYDLVISDVNMPDMDGFKLLELVGLEMDLPVIMLSAHSDTKLVMKGVTHGACDYLLKPVRIEELKNIWQHVLRRKRSDIKDQNKAPNEEKAPGGSGGGSQSILENSGDQNKMHGKRKRDQDEEEDDGNGEGNGDEDDPSTQKKPRVVWSAELHRKFVGAVNQLGLDKAVPKKILDLMNVEGLTRENVASHLQKYRLYLKKATQQVSMVAALGGSDSYLRMAAIDGYADFCSPSGSGRISSTTIPSYASNGIFGRLNSPASLSTRGISSSTLIPPIQPHNINSSLNKLGNIQPSVFSANQSPSLLQSIPTSIELNQSKQNSCTTSILQLTQIDCGGFAVSPGFPDSRVSVSNANNCLPCVSSSPLMLQGDSQQTHSTTAFGNQASSGGALGTESFDISICGTGSSNLLEYNRCNENWQSAAQLPQFPANSLPVCEAFNNDNLSPAEFSSGITAAVPLDDAILQPSSSSLTPQQRWEEHKLNYNQNMSRAFNPVNSQVSSRGVTNALGNSLNKNKTICGNRVDASFLGTVNGTYPSNSRCTEAEKFSSDMLLKSNEAYLLEQMKSHDGFIQDFVTLDGIMGAMVKREPHDMTLMDGEMGFDAYPVGSCI